MRHWEDAVFARLLLDRGIISRRILEGIPDDREEPLHAYLVRTGRLRPEEAVRLRGAALELPLVCVDCGRESILLRCVSGDRLACPACGGVPLIRPGPARSILTRKGTWTRALHIGLAAGVVALLTVAVLKTPFPKDAFKPRAPALPEVSRKLPAESLRQFEEATRRSDLVQARFDLLKVLVDADLETDQEAREILDLLDGKIRERESRFEEEELVYATWIEEAREILERLDATSRVADATLAERSRAAGIRLDDARDFYRSYLFTEMNLGLATIHGKARRGLGAQKKIRRGYLARSEERWAQILDHLAPPQDPLYCDTARDLLSTFPDLGVEEVTYRREQVSSAIEKEEAVNREEVGRRSGEVRRWVWFQLPVPARGTLADLPVPGQAALKKEVDDLRSLVATEFERMSTLIPGNTPVEGGVFGVLSRSQIRDTRWQRYEVTNRQYAFFLEETGHPAPHHWRDGKIPEGKEDHPVVNVTVEDARAYCKWAGGRLPTVEEWRWAAQGRDWDQEYVWGDDFEDRRANLRSEGTVAVGSFPGGKSRDGIYNMAGNVGEWVEDGETGEAAVKGGNFFDLSLDSAKVRRTWRGRTLPEMDEYIGFRLIYDVN